MGISSLIIGIISIIISIIPCLGSLAIIPAIIGLILGIISLATGKERKKSIIGIIMSSIAILIAIIWIIYALNTNNSSNNNNISSNTTQEPIETEEEKQARLAREEQEFKDDCEAYTFDQIARNPDNFKGTNVKLTGEVIQVVYSSNYVTLRVNITEKGTYTTYYTDTIYVTYYPSAGEDKILEDDIITLYGTSLGDYTYTSVLGAPVNLPWIHAKYLTIN